MKIAFILNPTAQGGRCAEVAERIRRWPFPDGVEWSLHLTQAPGDGQRLTEELADQQDVCCAVGGDGTLHEVAKVLFKKNRQNWG